MLPTPQLLGTATAISLADAVTATTVVSDDQAAAAGKELAYASNQNTITPADLAAVIAPYDDATRQKVIASYTANGGNNALMQSALLQLDMKKFSKFTLIFGVLSTISFAASVYHGYKRHEDGDHPILWALGWGLMGAMFPVVTPVIAVAEGYGKPLKK